MDCIGTLFPMSTLYPNAPKSARYEQVTRRLHHDPVHANRAGTKCVRSVHDHQNGHPRYLQRRIQPQWLSNGLNSTIKSAVNSEDSHRDDQYMRVLWRMVAIAPEKSMNAKIRSNPIRPERDRRIMGTKIVMSTRKREERKLSPRFRDPKGKQRRVRRLSVSSDFPVVAWFSNKIPSRIADARQGGKGLGHQRDRR